MNNPINGQLDIFLLKTATDITFLYEQSYYYLQNLIAIIPANDPDYLSKRNQLMDLTRELQIVYNKSYTGQISIEDFQNQAQALTQKGQFIFDGKMNPRIQIQKDYDQALFTLNHLKVHLNTYQQEINHLKSQLEEWQQEIDRLEQFINTLPDGDLLKEIAKQSLVTAKNQLSQISQNYEIAKAAIESLIDALSKNENDLNLLSQLNNKEEPTQEDVDEAHQLLNNIQRSIDFENQFNRLFPSLSQLETFIAALQRAQEDLNTNPYQRKVLEAHTEAQTILRNLKEEIKQKQIQIDSLITQIEKWESIIKQLEEKMKDLTNPEQKANAEQALVNAKTLLASLFKKFSRTSFDITNFNTLLTQAQTNFSALNELVKKTDASDEDLKIAQDLLTAIKVLENQFQTAQVSFQEHFPSTHEIEEINQAVLNFQNIVQPKAIKEGIGTYFDIGGLGSQIGNFINWSNGEFKVIEFSAYLQNLFSQMKEAGMSEIYLSFIQMSSLEAFLSGDFSGAISQYDAIGVQMKDLQKLHFPEGTNFLSLITDIAHQNGIRVSASVGGELARAEDFTLTNPTLQAHQLAEFMSKYGIDSIDFDIEGSTIEEIGVRYGNNSLSTLFSTLHSLLSTDGKTISLTLPGGANLSGSLYSLFINEKGENIAAQMFDDLNLMMYDSGQYYYLDTNTGTSWDIEKWLNILGKENAGMLHIGFQDKTPYESPTASASGVHYDIIPGSSSGSAAAQIYYQIQQKLIEHGYTTSLGDPFWWPHYDSSRYSPTGNFINATMQDFYDTLEKLNTEASTETQFAEADFSEKIKLYLLGNMQG